MDLGIPIGSFDVMEWFNWLKNNFIIIDHMVKDYEKKQLAKKNSHASAAMARMRAMMKSGRARQAKRRSQLSTPEAA